MRFSGRAVASIRARDVPEVVWQRVAEAARLSFGLTRRSDDRCLVWFDGVPGDEGRSVQAVLEIWGILTAAPATLPVIALAYHLDPPDQGVEAGDRLDRLEAAIGATGDSGVFVADPIPAAALDAGRFGVARSGAESDGVTWREVERDRDAIESIGLDTTEADDDPPEPDSPPFWYDLSPAAHHEVVGPGERATPADTVIATAFAPLMVAPNEAFLVQVFAHLAGDSTPAAKLAEEVDPDALRRAFKSLAAPVPRGSTLGFHLTIPGFEIPDAVAALVWLGPPDSVSFEVRAPAQVPRGSVATVVVSLDSVPIGHLRFALRSSWFTSPPCPAAQEAVRYQTAFVSYAAADRDEVLRRVQMLGPLGIRFFQDVMHLEPGVRWERELYRQIDDSDLFLLFWSTAARDSEWVAKEVGYALERQGADGAGPPAIVPVIIEGPPVVPPPPALGHLHFNDQVLYFMAKE